VRIKTETTRPRKHHEIAGFGFTQHWSRHGNLRNDRLRPAPSASTPTSVARQTAACTCRNSSNPRVAIAGYCWTHCVTSGKAQIQRLLQSPCLHE